MKHSEMTHQKLRALFTTAVWGTQYVDRFISYSLRTQLSERNLGAFDSDSLFLLITDSKSIKRIRSSAAYAELSKIMPVEFVEIDSIKWHSDDKYSILTSCQNYALARAIDYDAIFFGYSDALWADGSYLAAARRLEEGYDAVFSFGYQVLDDPFMAAVDEIANEVDTQAVAIPPRIFAQHVHRCLHPLVHANCWKNKWMTHCPSFLVWNVPNQGLLLRAFHMHPVVFRVRKEYSSFFAPFRTTLDEEFVARLSRTNPRIYVCPNSDEICVCSLNEETNLPYRMEPPRPVNIYDVVRYAEACAGLMHREIFSHPTRLLINDVDENTWRPSENEAAQVVAEIKQSLSIPDSVLALENPAIFAARLERQTTYQHWLDQSNDWQFVLRARYKFTRRALYRFMRRALYQLVRGMYLIGLTRAFQVIFLPIMPTSMEKRMYDAAFRLGLIARKRSASAASPAAQTPNTKPYSSIVQTKTRAEYMVGEKPRDEGSNCAVCGTRAITVVPEFSALPRVTSDCRPFAPGGLLGVCTNCGTIQKPDDEKWRAEASSIYQRYDMFRQSSGRAEQAVFDDKTGAPIRRSAVILTRLIQAHPLPKKGRALDVGCGNGPTLRALADLLPAWDLYGHEISDAILPSLTGIPGFRQLYTGKVDDIEGSFDLIVLSQSLEHVIDPVATLTTLRKKLMLKGILLIQVPNARLNVFDLVVADHRSHFDPRTLALAAQRAGFKQIVVTDWVFKELTMALSDAPLDFSSLPEQAQMTVEELALRVEWLESVVAMARDVAETSEQFGIFGTSIAGTWLLGALPDRVNFFVDEDPSRIGQHHENRPILSPAQVSRQATVFIPLIPPMAEGIAKRLIGMGIDARIPAHPACF